jgi:hypothetical protein
MSTINDDLYMMAHESEEEQIAHLLLFLHYVFFFNCLFASDARRIAESNIVLVLLKETMPISLLAYPSSSSCTHSRL